MLERNSTFPRGTGLDGMLSLLGNKNYPTVRGVRKLSDLPGVVNNEITLDPGNLFVIVGDVDLKGNRILSPGKAKIAGLGSEISSLTSDLTIHGWPADTAMIDAADTINLRDIAVSTSADHYCVKLDGTGKTNAVCDWMAVNFKGGKAGWFNNFDNFIASYCALLDPHDGLRFSGTGNTIGLDNSIFTSFNGGTSLILDSDFVLGRRFKVFSSAFVVGPGAAGINFPLGVTAATESYILDTVNFSGPGTHKAGVDYLDDRSRFFECRGITNTARVGQLYWSNNATVTALGGNTTDYFLLAGTSTPGALNQRFIHDNNILRYISELVVPFVCTATVSLTSGNNNQVYLAFAKNGTIITESIQPVTTNGAGRAENVTVQGITNLAEDDEISVYARNENGNDITATFLNVSAHEL